ncbi:MAG TPA: cell division protein ZapA [Terriglobales bacterium]|nr:cell division protein ZapA [Terriglobales bacterium]
MPPKPDGSVQVEIYDQLYNLRGSDPEYITRLAQFVDERMRSVASQAATVDSLRVAVLAALNIADEYHALQRKYDEVASQYNQRAQQLAGQIDEALDDMRRVG